MTYNEVLKYIHSKGNFSLPAGLGRIKAVLKKLGNPQNDFKAIHIAGTNGKGSVSVMLASVFKTAGFKTGLFISPFIINFRERIQINGEFISEDDLCYCAETVKKTGVELSEFEFITAMAFLYFSIKKIDILICETGLGGRLDATNALENKVVSVITKIGFDHTTVLGKSIEEITMEKCGILRSCPTVSSPYQPKGVVGILKSKACNLVVPDIAAFKKLKSDIFGNTYIYKGKKYEIFLCGDYQIENALTAIEVVEHSGYNIAYEDVYNGLKTAFFPARMEIISKKPLVILDGAHNTDGAAVLAKELSKLDEKATAIIGMMRDKDYKDVLSKVLPYCKNAVCVSVPQMPRSLEEKQLCDIAQEYCNAVTAKSINTALPMAVELSDGAPIIVFGSLYLASAIRPVLKDFFK